MKEKKVLAIYVIGDQKTGKSTILNHMTNQDNQDQGFITGPLGEKTTSRMQLCLNFDQNSDKLLTYVDSEGLFSNESEDIFLRYLKELYRSRTNAELKQIAEETMNKFYKKMSILMFASSNIIIYCLDKAPTNISNAFLDAIAEKANEINTYSQPSIIFYCINDKGPQGETAYNNAIGNYLLPRINDYISDSHIVFTKFFDNKPTDNFKDAIRNIKQIVNAKAREIEFNQDAIFCNYKRYSQAIEQMLNTLNNQQAFWSPLQLRNWLAQKQEDVALKIYKQKAEERKLFRINIHDNFLDKLEKEMLKIDPTNEDNIKEILDFITEHMFPKYRQCDKDCPKSHPCKLKYKHNTICDCKEYLLLTCKFCHYPQTSKTIRCGEENSCNRIQKTCERGCGKSKMVCGWQTFSCDRMDCNIKRTGTFGPNADAGGKYFELYSFGQPIIELWIAFRQINHHPIIVTDLKVRFANGIVQSCGEGRSAFVQVPLNGDLIIGDNYILYI